MASEPLVMRPGGAVEMAARLRRLIPAPDSVSGAVAKILARVRAGGDGAVAELTERFDTPGRRAPALRVTSEELAAAGDALAPDVRNGLRIAFDNVHTTARAGVAPDRVGVVTPDCEITLREEPVRRAAVYVPGGRAPYPSTVVMGVAAASAAGVSEIAVCSPPSDHGQIDQVILGACHLTGVGEVYRMGGAQAIAALAYGTEAVVAVDVIVGPGNLFVQEAKRQVSNKVGIDGFAGPSDLLVIVEDDAGDLEPIVLDLLAQSEHGPGTLVVGVSTSQGVLERLAAGLEDAPDTGAVIRLVHAPALDDALELAEAFAPEHLQLAGVAAEGLAPRVTRSGAVFIGAQTGTAFGDYIAGSNHVLPTNGAARFASGLSASHFRRRFAEVRVTDPEPLARAAAPVARAEGFELHARSMEARIRQNRP